MTTPFLCVLLAYLLRWPTHVYLARRGDDGPGLLGVRKAHEDGLRGFAPFAAGVLVAHLTGLDERRTTVLCIAYLVARTLHPVLLRGRLDYLGSAVWVVSIVVTVALFVLPWLG